MKFILIQRLFTTGYLAELPEQMQFLLEFVEGLVPNFVKNTLDTVLRVFRPVHNISSSFSILTPPDIGPNSSKVFVSTFLGGATSAISENERL